MHIDWTHFSPLPAFCGGALIGLAAAWLMLFHGHILGATGILAEIWRSDRSERNWRIALIAGLVAAPIASAALFVTLPPHFEVSTPVLLIGGLAVGAGTRLANGCTSGHGVCGLARLSPRSLIATPVFMAAAFATVFLVRHMGLR